MAREGELLRAPLCLVDADSGASFEFHRGATLVAITASRFAPLGASSSNSPINVSPSHPPTVGLGV